MLRLIEIRMVTVEMKIGKDCDKHKYVVAIIVIRNGKNDPEKLR